MAQTPQFQPAPEPEGKANILLVDDQPESLLALEAILQDLGQNLVTARSGQEALWHLLKENFAAILMDVRMPGMDGFETASLIRERDKSRHIPIIFMTAAYRNEANVFRGYAVGAVDYIIKPVIPEILRSKVSVLVDLAKKTETIKRQAELLREAERREHQKQIEDAMAFSHAVSHDLRAPLRHIESFGQILNQNYGDKLDERGRDLIERMSGAARRMVDLIEALFKLSEAARGEVRQDIVNISTLAQDVKTELMRSEPERKVEFLIQEGLTAIGDPHLLRVALENLLGNAWKYTGRKDLARIEVGRTLQEGAAVYFVRDDGAGFDMRHADKLFLPFSRLHARGEFEGTGLGLATVQRIIRRHGGRIWGESSPQKGAVFFFTLPAAGMTTGEAQNSGQGAALTRESA